MNRKTLLTIVSIVFMGIGILSYLLSRDVGHEPLALAATTAYKSPTAQANDGWTNSSLMEAQDGSSATGDFNAQVDQITFGFSASDIPADSTIDGVTVEIDHHKTGTNNNTLDINLINVGTCTTKNFTMDSTDDDAYEVLGGVADTWDCTALTQENIINSAFGVDIRARKTSGPNPAAGSYNVDHVRVKVDYTAPEGGEEAPPARQNIIWIDSE